jgi:isochorismate synthase EntC
LFFFSILKIYWFKKNEKKFKENEMQLANTKKNLAERQLLIDYLKKELE